MRNKFNPVCEIDNWRIPSADNIQNLLKNFDHNNSRKILSKRFHKGLPCQFISFN